MKGRTAEPWRELCAQAAEKQDRQKLMKLVADMTRMLEEKEQRLKKKGREQSNRFRLKAF